MGIFFSRREKGTHDFFLGGQRVKWWAAGISIFGTQLSAITFMAIPAKVYATDWTYILAQFSIILVAPVIITYFLPFFRRLNITSAYEFLGNRFGPHLRILGAVVFCLIQLGRMAIVLYLPAMALTAVTGINITLCILLMGVFCTFYTVLGGIEAVIWTDVVQVFILMGGALLCVAVISTQIEGGLASIFQIGWDEGKFRVFHWSWDMTTAALWVVLIGSFFSNLVPYSADQTVVQRYLTTPTEKQARRAIWTNAALTVPASLLFFFLGTALYVFYQHNPQALNSALKTDVVLPWFIASQLPAGFAGLVLAALFAAAMSSLDSSLNSMSAVLVTDLYHRIFKKRSDNDLRLARGLTIILGIIGTSCALVLAHLNIQSLWDLFLALTGLLGGSLAGVFILGIFIKRATRTGALLGFAISAVTLLLVQQLTQLHFFLYGLIGIGVCILIGTVSSLIFHDDRGSSSPQYLDVKNLKQN
jgi:SSS family transporter